MRGDELGNPLLEVNGRVATIILNRPEKANSLTPEDLLWLRDCFSKINADPDIVVLQFKSQGKHFCSGFDISALDDAGEEARSIEFGDVADALEALRPVTIAAIQGGVFGGATDLCLACDFRLGTPQAEMSMPAVRLGLHYYQGGLERYISRLGLNAAKRLFLTAERIDAATMLDIGFLTQLVDPDDLEPSLASLTAGLVQMAPLPLMAMKRHLNHLARGVLDPRQLRQAVLLAQNSDDHKEAVTAWKKKRVPVFKGS